MKPYLIGITGGSGSGKTTLLKRLLKQFKETDVCLISQDHYYKPIEEQQIDEQGVVNFDLPEAVNLDKFYEDIFQLCQGKIVEKLEYTFNNPQKTPDLLIFKPAPVILVEGLFIFHYQPIRELLNLKIIIDVEEHIRLKRRILRDNQERGYDLHDVLYRYEKHVSPSYKRYIAAYRYEADLIIPNHHHFDNAFEVLCAFIETKIQKVSQNISQ
ncbi:MAG: AAA family ATPase [Microscillaceae bacterium]|nr:AAA family ATPase [Microscillaceae bacterium]MDW8459942.1 AAA family ATPase [Cytophagales bacterium]